ncbi:hypothetical protein [Luteimonas sp. SDU101]|uniref:hypothetical protein n=1 Tax=unclassified Luteimonas TaxID=2629088 RepID=UPI003EC05DFE
MSSVFFRSLHARFDASGMRDMFTPRKPRNPLLRVALGLVGIALLSVLLVVGLVVGVGMLAFGLVRGALRPRAARPRAGTLDAEYRVVSKPALR